MRFLRSLWRYSIVHTIQLTDVWEGTQEAPMENIISVGPWDLQEELEHGVVKCWQPTPADSQQKKEPSRHCIHNYWSEEQEIQCEFCVCVRGRWLFHESMDKSLILMPQVLFKVTWLLKLRWWSSQIPTIYFTDSVYWMGLPLQWEGLVFRSGHMCKSDCFGLVWVDCYVPHFHSQSRSMSNFQPALQHYAPLPGGWSAIIKNCAVSKKGAT